MSRYKIIVVGDGGTGKTSFIRRFITGNYIDTYTPTVGVDVHVLKLHTNHGQITLELWDTAGTEEFKFLGDGYYLNAKGALVFYSLTDQNSLIHVPKWSREVQRVCPNIPMVVCGNKCEFIKGKCPIPEYLYVSARACINFEEPFLRLITLLTGYEDIYIIPESPAAPLIDPKSFSVLSI